MILIIVGNAGLGSIPKIDSNLFMIYLASLTLNLCNRGPQDGFLHTSTSVDQ
jgi:hypothetical protein